MPSPALLTALAVAAAATACGDDERAGAPPLRAQAEPAATTATEPAEPGATGTATAPRSPAAAIARLPLRRQAGRLVVMRFTGTAVPRYVLRALRRGHAAGVILFADNVASRTQLRRMTRAIQRAARGRAIVSIDQEGGIVRRIPWAAPRTGQPSLATAGAARATARAAARDLRSVGVNVNLAPVADVADAPGSAMAARAFPGGGRRVARLVAASVRGYAGRGVLPTVKHFPGLGASAVNTDFGAATVRGLDAGDLRPFKAAIRARVPLVMLSHAVYPQLDAARLASQSHEVVTVLLRRRLGYRGVVVTDALEADAVVRRSGVGVAGVRSVRAGADLLLATGPGSFRPVLDALVAQARRSRAFRARVRASAVRVAALRRRLSAR